MRARSAVLALTAAILLLALAASGCSSDETASTDGAGASASATYETVDVQTAYDALSSDVDAQLVDVREPDEWAETGVAPGRSWRRISRST
jgi:ABC-type oligopeptide transport system substrate-binding subunit